MRVDQTFEYAGNGTLVDADVDGDGRVVALVQDGDVLTLVESNVATALEIRARYPLIRALDPKHVLVIDRSRDDITRNAFVVSRSGHVTNAFGVGDAIDDVAVCGDRIVVSYFDEGCLSESGFARNGIAVFTRDGSFEFGYASHFGKDAVEIADADAMCVDDHQEIWFCPYTEYPLVRLDPVSRTQRVLPRVREITLPIALSIGDGSAYFQGTLEDRAGIFERRFDTAVVRRIGEWSKGRLRGIPGGRFLGIDSNAVFVIAPDMIARGVSANDPG